jgi:hypothetical protein
MVRAAARTGTDSSSRKLVSRILQQKRVSSRQSTRFMAAMVVMKLMAPKRLLKPATCRLKIR